MRWLRKYIAIARIAVSSNLAYAGEVAGRMFFLAVILFIFLKLWQATYAFAGTRLLGHLSLPEMLWYLCFTEAIVMSGPRVAFAIDEDVRTGYVTVQLVRPLSYPLYRLASTLGERLVRFFSTLVVGSMLTWFFVGPFDLRLEGLVLGVVAALFAFVLDFLGHFLVGIGAFWFEDTSGIFLIYSRLTMILGGMLVPIALFPEAVQPVLNALPFSAMVSGPARLFIKPDLSLALDVFAHQVVWIVVFSLAVNWLYGQACKRVFVNGG